MMLSDDVPQTEVAVFPVVPWDHGLATFVPGQESEGEAPWAVVVFVVSGDRFLLGRVSRGWCTPSGHIEPGETPEDAARREVAEETGGHVDAIQAIGRFVTWSDPGAPSTAMVFLAHVDRCDPLPAASEATDMGWFALDEVPSIYWHWDVLMARMFAYAQELARRNAGEVANE